MANPTQQEVDSIRRAWGILEAIVAAMGDKQIAGLQTAMVMCWQDLRDWFPPGHSITMAEARAASKIAVGIKRKLVIGVDNDTFHYSHTPGGNDGGQEYAYDFGQKLVRWNRLMEQRFLDRLFKRKGPLETDKLLFILDDADLARKAWWQRHIEDGDND